MALKDFRPHGVSLGDVAKRMGKARSTVQKIETSENPGIFTIQQWADAVGLPTISLVEQILSTDEKSVQSA